MIKRIWAIIDEIEKKLGIDFGIDFIEYTDSIFFRRVACFIADEHECTIRVGSGLSGRHLKEIIYHELGHSLIWNYRIPKNMLRIFWDDPYSLGIMDTDSMYKFATTPIYLKLFGKDNNHFLTDYCQINPEEDFAENFSAVLSNDFCKKKLKTSTAKTKSVLDVIKFIQSK